MILTTSSPLSIVTGNPLTFRILLSMSIVNFPPSTEHLNILARSPRMVLANMLMSWVVGREPGHGNEYALCEDVHLIMAAYYPPYGINDLQITLLMASKQGNFQKIQGNCPDHPRS